MANRYSVVEAEVSMMNVFKDAVGSKINVYYPNKTHKGAKIVRYIDAHWSDELDCAIGATLVYEYRGDEHRICAAEDESMIDVLLIEAA